MDDQLLPTMNPNSPTSARAAGRDPRYLTKADIALLIDQQSTRITLARREFANKNKTLHNVSDAWRVFDVVKVDGEVVDFVSCSQCGIIFKYTVKEGTSTLTRHIRSCIGTTKIELTSTNCGDPQEVPKRVKVTAVKTARPVRTVRHGGRNVGEQMEALEISLEKFKAEMTMKMAIVEQVINSRIDQFEFHTDLIRKEKSLVQTLMNQWKEITEFAETGVSFAFSNVTVPSDVDLGASRAGPNSDRDSTIGSDSDSSSTTGNASKKRKSSARARRDRAKRLRQRINYSDNIKEDPESDGNTSRPAPRSPWNNRQSDTSKCKDNAEELEKKVYINVYSPPDDGLQNGPKYSKPIWKSFLEEENGATVLCKHCDTLGKQTIITNHHSHLIRHVQSRHPSVFEELQAEPDPPPVPKGTRPSHDDDI